MTEGPLQNHAPPIPGEKTTDVWTYRGPLPRPYNVWTKESGWCSACLVDDVPIVQFGSNERCVGICTPCIIRLVDAARAVPDPDRATEPGSEVKP